VRSLWFLPYDAESGLHYNYCRTYDPGTGTYLEADPAGQAAGINRYAYARATPTVYVDPSGRFGFVGAGIGVVAGGIAGYEAGGTQGAFVGGLIGLGVGIVAPEFSAQAGSAAAALLGSEATSVTAVSTFVAFNALVGAGSTVYGNLIGGKDDLSEGVPFGTATGAVAPVLGGEAVLIGLGGEAAFGAGVANVYGALTGAFAILGEAFDPNAAHGFATRKKPCP